MDEWSRTLIIILVPAVGLLLAKLFYDLIRGKTEGRGFVCAYHGDLNTKIDKLIQEQIKGNACLDQIKSHIESQKDILDSIRISLEARRS